MQTPAAYPKKASSYPGGKVPTRSYFYGVSSPAEEAEWKEGNRKSIQRSFVKYWKKRGLSLYLEMDKHGVNKELENDCRFDFKIEH